MNFSHDHGKAAVELEALQFDNSFVRTLPQDPNRERSSRQVYAASYSLVEPIPVNKPELYGWSDDLASLLRIKKPDNDQAKAIEVLAGNLVLPGMQPYAACYGGHQFGHWAGQLGDGRAITLAEILSPSGQRWEIQLKGAGPTPYSRQADGRAVLRSSIREFLCSEAMHHLGVPTTRALSLIKTADQVVRDMFYDGHPELESCAIVARVAPTFIRFGNFEIHYSRNETAILRQLANYTITQHFPDFDLAAPDVYLQWFIEVCRRTAVLISHWLRVGFVHGVMNTDNMSILGLTIDYGPYGWLDVYDPDWTPNTTDAGRRRYRFGNQASIALWNLSKLAQAISPLLSNPEVLQAGLEVYQSTFAASYQQMLAQKLGLAAIEGREDIELVNEMFQVMQLVETDMTIFYRCLAKFDTKAVTAQSTAKDIIHALMPAFYTNELGTSQVEEIASWLRKYAARVQQDGMEAEKRVTSMNAVNPKYVLRNYLAQQAIDAAEKGDKSLIENLQQIMRHPYDEQPEFEKFAAKRPEWARTKAGCSALSCSS